MKQKVQKKYGQEKPKLVLVNCAGGGLKASYWTMKVLQELDKNTKNNFLDHTVLITGASGGMFGAAYFRELVLQKKQGKKIDYTNNKYTENMGKDLLNSVATSIVMNDIFYPFQTIKKYNNTYRKDRGFYFNKQVNENLNNTLNKNLTDYKIPEKKALIPMMILNSTIINDQKNLIFSAQNVSYLIKPYIENSNGYLDYIIADGVEFNRYFKNVGAENLNFTDALRMNASYPYLMPAVYLPTNPEIKAMDAGIRENSGFGMSTRFYSVFKNWIDENTSGVIYVIISVDNKVKTYEKDKKTTYLADFFEPLGTIFYNMIMLQEYNMDINMSYLENSSKTDINIINFLYKPQNTNQKASLSWHLTTQEKQDIQKSFHQLENQESLQRLKNLLNIKN